MTHSSSSMAGPTDWKHAHQALCDLQRVRGALDADEGTSLLAALRSGAHRKLGYASFFEYIERCFGYGPRWTHERLRVAEALEKLPLTSSALRSGRLVWSAVRELTRVATRETEPEWLELVAGRSVRDVERLVAGRAPGDRPDDPPDPGCVRHVLRFEVTAEVFASFRQAVGVLKRQSGGTLTDEEALLLMARHILGGSADAGRANYQIGVTRCENCQRARQHGLEGAHGALRFRHADGSPYGEPQSPNLIDLYHKVHRALRCQGFGETQTRRALEQVRRERAHESTLESILRCALAVLVA